MSPHSTEVTDPIQRAVDCTRCGYRLTGLDPRGLCPECGYEIGKSLESNQLLRTTDPEWLARIERGLGAFVRLRRVVYAALLALIVLGAGGGVAVTTDAPDLVATVFLWIFVPIMIATGLASIGLHLFACWTLSARSHSIHAPAPWARACVRFGGAALVVALGWCAADMRLFSRATWDATAMRIAVQAVGLGFLVGLARTLQSLRLGAPSIPQHDRMTRAAARDLRWVVALLAVGWAIALYRGGWPRLGWSPILIALAYITQIDAGANLRKHVRIERAIQQSGASA